MIEKVRREIRYGTETLEIPELPFPLDPIPLPEPAPAREPASVEAALGRPVGSDPLEDVVRGARRVLVVVSDATRATGSAEFLPVLVRRVQAASRASVSLIVASGIHRRPTDDEIDAIVGPELRGRHEVLRHDPDDASRLVELGRTSAGTRVLVHASVREHDRVILTGSAGFHYYAGFSGGRKALVPGLAARETVSRNHLRALTATGERHPLAQAARLDGNPVHRDMAEGAAMVRPAFLLNTVLGPGGRIERVFAGNWRRAHEAACRYVRRTRSLRVSPRELVLVSAGGEPGDINLIQSHKAFEAAMGALRPGGVFILVARCREGAGHPEFLPWFRYRSEAELVRELQSNFQVYGQTALAWRRKASRCRLILVSDLPDEIARTIGAEPARDVVQALGMAREGLGSPNPGWLVPHGARVLLQPV